MPSRGGGASKGGGGGRSGGGGGRSGGGRSGGGGGRGGGGRSGGGRSAPSHSKPSHPSHPPSHHTTTVHHSSSSTTVHVSTGGGGGGGGNSKGNSLAAGVFLFICGIICIICCVVVALDGGKEITDDCCTSVDTLNRMEQAFCSGDKENLGVDIDKGAGYASVYKVKNSSLSTVTRTYDWLDYDSYLEEGSYEYFSLYALMSLDVQMTFRINDTNSSLKFYFLTSQQFAKATNYGHFDEDMFEPDAQDFPVGNTTWPPSGLKHAGDKGFYYLVWSSQNETEFYYDIHVEYKVYDMSGQKKQDCPKGECKFVLGDKEVLFVDFESSGTSTEDTLSSEPEYIEFEFYTYEIDTSSAVAGAIVLAIVAVLMFAGSVLFLYKYLKKIGKLGKKVAKKLEKAVEEGADKAEHEMEKIDHDPNVSTPSASADPNAPVAAAPVAYAADPNAPVAYAADPNAPAAAYAAGAPAAYAADPNAGAAYGAAPAAGYGADPNGAAYGAAPAAGYGVDPNAGAPAAGYGADPNAGAPAAGYGADPNAAAAYPGQPYPGQPYPGQV